MVDSSIELRAKVYTASKLHHAPLWRAFSIQNAEWLTVISRWIDMATFDDEHASEELKRQGWIIDEQDVRESDYVLCYAPDSEVIRGALVEAGMGIAFGKKIICVGVSPSFGTWQYHPKVVCRVSNLWEAVSFIKVDHFGKSS